MAGVPAHRRPVNTVFQSYALFPHMTVAGNVAYSLEVAHVPREERARRVGEALALVEPGGRAGPAPSGPALRRPAAARGARPRDRRPAEDPAARRAPVGARPQAQAGHAAGAEDPAERARHRLRLRHPRPGGGADHVRPHRRLDEGRMQQERHADQASITGPTNDFVAQLPRREQPVRRARGLRIDGAEALVETDEGPSAVVGPAEGLAAGQRGRACSPARRPSIGRSRTPSASASTAPCAAGVRKCSRHRLSPGRATCRAARCSGSPCAPPSATASPPAPGATLALNIPRRRPARRPGSAPVTRRVVRRAPGARRPARAADGLSRRLLPRPAGDHVRLQLADAGPLRRRRVELLPPELRSHPRLGRHRYEKFDPVYLVIFARSVMLAAVTVAALPRHLLSGGLLGRPAVAALEAPSSSS